MLKIFSFKKIIKVSTGNTKPEKLFSELQMAIVFTVVELSKKTNLPYEELIKLLCKHLSDPSKIESVKKKLIN